MRNLTSTFGVKNPSSFITVEFYNQYAILIKGNNQDDNGGVWYLAMSFAIRLLVYILILGLLVIIIGLIFKCFGYSDTGDPATAMETETNPLLPKAANSLAYRTCEEDAEKGNCGNGSPDDLYDGKICVICYEESRNCFFIPCGHCVTCYVCAQRIFKGENKACPVCRRLIHRVRKLSVA